MYKHFFSPTGKPSKNNYPLTSIAVKPTGKKKKMQRKATLAMEKECGKWHSAITIHL